jgi:hypothetical protein
MTARPVKIADDTSHGVGLSACSGWIMGHSGTIASGTLAFVKFREARRFRFGMLAARRVGRGHANGPVRMIQLRPEYNPGGMPLQTLHTLSHNKPFDYKYADGEEMIVYPSDDDCHAQKKYAIVITRFEQQLVKDGIRGAGTITIGASRDKPPKGSLGAVLKAHGCSPQF